MPDHGGAAAVAAGAGARHGPERASTGWSGSERRLKALADKRVLTDPLAFVQDRRMQLDYMQQQAGRSAAGAQLAPGAASGLPAPGGHAGRPEPPEGAGPGLCHGPDGGGRHPAQQRAGAARATASSCRLAQGGPGLPGGGRRRRRRRHGKERPLRRTWPGWRRSWPLLEKGDAQLSAVPGPV